MEAETRPAELSLQLLQQSYPLRHQDQTDFHYAHKVMLSAKSHYFYNAFTGGFKEACDTVMELQDDDPDHFEFLLRYLYNETYDKDAISELADGDAVKRVTIPIGILAAADKYVVPDLRNFIAWDVEEVLENKTCPSEVAQAAVKAFYEDRVAGNKCVGIRITSAILYRYPRLPVIGHGPFISLLQTQPMFAIDVALSLHERYGGSFRPYMCGECGLEGKYRRCDEEGEHPRCKRCGCSVNRPTVEAMDFA